MSGVPLKYLEFGESGPPVVILHGLFGSSRNWSGVGRALSDAYHVYALDQRNHGESPHTATHTLSDLSGDLDAWLSVHTAEPSVLLGHSMGGLVVMRYALSASQKNRSRAVIIVDIAPRTYPPHHQKEFAALRTDVGGMRTREEVDRAMSLVHPDPMVRQFLQMNLMRTDTGFEWKINVDGLEGSRFMEERDFSGSYDGPALFITGGASSYVLESDRTLIMERFPRAQILTLPGADHYLHYTAQAAFLGAVREFLKSV
ncbi:MAG: alpha/beta fold hydrolase [Spirochaetia bacterium]|nr:alpha/beta fold hydrolase [Spirochaetia bacterium]